MNQFSNVELESKSNSNLVIEFERDSIKNSLSDERRGTPRFGSVYDWLNWISLMCESKLIILFWFSAWRSSCLLMDLVKKSMELKSGSSQSDWGYEEAIIENCVEASEFDIIKWIWNIKVN